MSRSGLKSQSSVSEFYCRSCTLTNHRRYPTYLTSSCGPWQFLVRPIQLRAHLPEGARKEANRGGKH